MRKRLGIRSVTAMKSGEVLWDSMVTGFGARRQQSEAISYFLFYRSAGRQRWLTIGRHGAPWTPDTARAEAGRVPIIAFAHSYGPLRDVVARTTLAASSGLPVWINRYGYLSDAKIDALGSALRV